MPSFIFAGVSHYETIRPAVAKYVRHNPGKSMNDIVGVVSADPNVWKTAHYLIGQVEDSIQAHVYLLVHAGVIWNTAGTNYYRTDDHGESAYHDRDRLTRQYVDCECSTNYIHPAIHTPNPSDIVCFSCDAMYDDVPNSHAIEAVMQGLPLDWQQLEVPRG